MSDGGARRNQSPGSTFSIDDASVATEALSEDGPDETTEHLLNVQSHRFSIAQGQQELLSVEEIKDRIKLLDHQLNAAHRALFQMGSGALFADEVGLGKTIEIGMVLKEMDFRDSRDTFLVLTPAQLAPQWQDELQEKFGLEFVCNYDDDFEGFDAHDKIVASVDTAKSKTHRDDVLSRRWDVVVLDEAHHVRNADTQRYELMDAIDYGNAFFATATPIQNDITDLYNVVDLIRPGLLGTEQEFNRRYVADRESAQIKNADDLQRKLKQVMIRNRREETKIDFTNREVHTNVFEPADRERELYDEVTRHVREHYSSQGARHLVLLTLQKEVVSSPYAVEKTVSRWLADKSKQLSRAERQSMEEIQAVVDRMGQTTKQQRLQNVIETIQEQLNTTRVVVFTQFRPTQDAIAESVRTLDEPVHVVNGDLSSKQKAQKVADFEAEGGVMVATDSISEGRNMQFCNVLVNYDLPWNPMKVEQRIGRVDRIGQNREVHVFNMALEDTVEEHVLDKLYGKIDLFNQSIGGLRDILSRMEQSGSDFEQEVFERLRSADSEVELENNFEEMAVDLEENTEAAEKMNDFNQSVFDSFEFEGNA
ncbi:DEAD/DEAH box helicase [Halorientalis regularis]|uniref:Helicase conserved C-terminal domain-containing protein n=1 Tax=Halorientalis regularis TaxID=660518 RepID=A0A1G7QDR8_9EURY|nr:SNF2-related protein [Halorientalis regularis]SDF96628.1 Helicase conserved C-terminal domain-containing protein [Halorientalis regularis]